MVKRISKSYLLTSRSEAETILIGKTLGEKLKRGCCISVVGPLGAGKTVFIRGVCLGLGVAENILSPTFILYEEFQGRLPVVHADLYRLEHEMEIEELGLFEKLGSDAVILVEWGDRSPYLLRSSDLVAELKPSGTGRGTCGDETPDRAVKISFECEPDEVIDPLPW